MKTMIAVALLAGYCWGQSTTGKIAVAHSDGVAVVKDYRTALAPDVPAIKKIVKFTRKEWDLDTMDKYVTDDDLKHSCQRNAGTWKDGGCFLLKNGCSDPRRILIGPDGFGTYWCHLPQN